MKKILLTLLILQPFFTIQAESYKKDQREQKSRQIKPADRVLLIVTGAVLVALGCKSYHLAYQSDKTEEGLKKLVGIHCSDLFKKDDKGITRWDKAFSDANTHVKSAVAELINPLRGLHKFASMIFVTLGGYLIHKALVYDTNIIDPSNPSK